MPGRIVLISDDSDFFDFIRLKLELRTSDELHTLCFDEVPNNMDLLSNSVLIVNSENSNQKTIELLGIFNQSTPIIVTAYNDDETFKRKCYRAGMLDFIPLLTSDAEFRARMLPALNLVSVLEKNNQYRNMLVKNKILSEHNEVFINYENVIDSVLAELKTHPAKAVFAAIAPDDKNKYLLTPNSIETFLQSHIRKNDILMKYTHNKYYLIMYNTDVQSAEKHWDKISEGFQQKIYAGFAEIKNQSRQQLINTALVNLQESYGGKKSAMNKTQSSVGTNFKMRRKYLSEKLEILINPVFYRVQQKYMNRLTGVKIEQDYANGRGFFNIVGKHFMAEFRISSPGFSTINIDISITKDPDGVDSKRITFEPDEFDEGLLEDLLEQFIRECKHNYIC